MDFHHLFYTTEIEKFIDFTSVLASNNMKLCILQIAIITEPKFIVK